MLSCSNGEALQSVSSEESLSNLVCTIDPQAIAQKAGAGADCTFDPGASR